MGFMYSIQFVKSLIGHLGLAIGNVRHVRWFSWTLVSEKIANKISLNYTRKHIYRATIISCNVLQFYHVTILSHYYSIAIQFYSVTFLTQYNSVKVQFRGPKLYKKKGALFQEESYLPRIFRSLSLDLHTFHLTNIVFWWQIFFRNHGKSTAHDTAMFWSLTLWSWHHNAGARELSANHTLQSMTTTCR